MQEKIIAAIAAYLERETIHDYISEHKCVKFGGLLNPAGIDHAGFCQEIATEIAAAVAPMVEEKDLPLSELFTHMSEQHDLTLTDTELADIIHVSRGK